MQRLWDILQDSGRIIRKAHLSGGHRFALLMAYLKVSWLRFGNKRWRDLDDTVIHILGFHIRLHSFSDFFWTFREVFVLEDYRATTDKDEPFFIDGGGNLGITTLYFLWRYPNARVLVFEPHPETLAILTENITANNLKKVQVEEVAISDKEGQVALLGDDRAATISEELYTTDRQVKGRSRGESRITITTTPLSPYITEEVDYLKIDIEGAEGLVIGELAERGVLEKVREIAIEYHSGDESNDLRAIIDHLEEHNYIVVSEVSPTVPATARPNHFMIYATREYYEKR